MFDNWTVRQLISSTICRFGNLSVRQYVGSATYQFNNMSVWQLISSTICRFGNLVRQYVGLESCNSVTYRSVICNLETWDSGKTYTPNFNSRLPIFCGVVLMCLFEGHKINAELFGLRIHSVALRNQQKILLGLGPMLWFGKMYQEWVKIVSFTQITYFCRKKW
jgi:hypothetical protein